MAVLAPEYGAAFHDRLANDFKLEYQRLRADGNLDPEPLYPGVAKGLADLAGAGWLLGVATGKSDRGLAFTLAHHGLAHHFVTLQTADRHPSKPHPSMLRAALAEAGALPEHTVMIGDTVFDMSMAGAAQVRALGVAWGYHERGNCWWQGRNGGGGRISGTWSAISSSERALHEALLHPGRGDPGQWHHP